MGELPDLLQGIGDAAPGPLFFVDLDGAFQPLNALAASMDAAEASTVGYMSPVVQGQGRVGHIVGYVKDDAASGDEALVAALVALAARVAGGSIENSDAEAGRTQVTRVSDSFLEEAVDRMAMTSDPREVGAILARAAQVALGARGVATFLRADAGTRLEPIAAAGMDVLGLRALVPGRRLLGWAVQRNEPTRVASPQRIPEGAPRHDGACSFESWLELPLLVMPLRSGDHLLGALVATGLPSVPGRNPSSLELRQLERVIDRAIVTLAGACLLQQARREERVAREIEIARQIQQSLLPREAAVFPGLQIAGECRPAAQVSGDFLGYKEIVPGELTATVFDVTGHGIGAAFCMTLVRSALHGEYLRGGTLAGVLDRANLLLWEDLAGSGLFATAFLMRFDRKRGIVRHANAGHSRPILWSATERRFRDRRDGGLPLGLVQAATYAEGDVEFGQGDLLVAYTDGIVEADSADGEKFGRGRLMAVVRRYRRRSARVILRAIWRELDRFTGGQPLVDDATLLVVRGEAGFGTREPRLAQREDKNSAQRTPLDNEWDAVLAK